MTNVEGLKRKPKKQFLVTGSNFCIMMKHNEQDVGRLMYKHFLSLHLGGEMLNPESVTNIHGMMSIYPERRIVEIKRKKRIEKQCEESVAAFICKEPKMDLSL